MGETEETTMTSFVGGRKKATKTNERIRYLSRWRVGVRSD